MGKWLFRTIAVLLLGATAWGVWNFGSQFASDLRRERDNAAALDVPTNDLAELSGEATVQDDRLDVSILNTTIWHLTYVSLELETADEQPPLAVEVTQNFRTTPWIPGAFNGREIFLASEWNGRPVKYRVVSAEGFQ